MAKIIVVDIDGTLCVNGEVNKSLLNILKMYKQQKYTIIIATGRHPDNEKVTKGWFKDMGIPYDYLFMKPADMEDEPTRKWKIDFMVDWLAKRNQKPDDIELVFGNRARTCKKWASIGVPSMLVFGEAEVDGIK